MPWRTRAEASLPLRDRPSEECSVEQSLFRCIGRGVEKGVEADRELEEPDNPCQSSQASLAETRGMLQIFYFDCLLNLSILVLVFHFLFLKFLLLFFTVIYFGMALCFIFYSLPFCVLINYNSEKYAAFPLSSVLWFYFDWIIEHLN